MSSTNEGKDAFELVFDALDWMALVVDSMAGDEERREEKKEGRRETASRKNVPLVF